MIGHCIGIRLASIIAFEEPRKIGIFFQSIGNCNFLEEYEIKGTLYDNMTDICLQDSCTIETYYVSKAGFG